MTLEQHNLIMEGAETRARLLLRANWDTSEGVLFQKAADTIDALQVKIGELIRERREARIG